MSNPVYTPLYQRPQSMLMVFGNTSIMIQNLEDKTTGLNYYYNQHKWESQLMLNCLSKTLIDYFVGQTEELIYMKKFPN